VSALGADPIDGAFLRWCDWKRVEPDFDRHKDAFWDALPPVDEDGNFEGGLPEWLR
jgi:hypothetical protein